MKKSVLAVMLICLIATSATFAAGDSESGKVKTITMWCAYSQPERIEAMDDAIAKFESENPDIHVVRELVPWSNINQKWITAKMAGTLPQMVVASDSTLMSMWEAGDLLPVNDVVDMVGGPQAFLQGPLNGFKVGDDYIGLPHYTLSWKMVVRTDWLDELGLDIPKTWEEFAAAAIAMTNPPARYGFDLPLSKSAYKAKEWLAYFMRTNGADFFDENGKVIFDSPETVETVRFLVDLYKKAGRPAAINYTENDCIDNFARGTVGFIFAAGSLVSNVSKINPDVLKHCAVIATPSHTTPPIDGAGPVGIGKFKGVPNSEETNRFLTFLLADEDVYREFLLSMSGQIPVTVAGTNDELYLNDPLIADYANLYDVWIDGAMTGTRVGMEHGLSPYGAVGIPGSEIEDMFHAILIDGVSVEKAVTDTQNRIIDNLDAAGYPQK